MRCGLCVAQMNFVEKALTFDCRGERVVAILAEPAAASDLGLVIVVGGPQYRIGSHRQFVLLARRIAASGVAVLRFDYRGMGDSTGPTRAFDEATPDIAAAIDALQNQCPKIRRVVLWGLCDAAASSLLYWHSTEDARVAGIVLVNPWVRSETSMARAELKHYYGRRWRDRAFWTRLVQGKVDVAGALWTIVMKVKVSLGRPPAAPASAMAPFQDRMAQGLRTFTGPVLLLLSEHDLTAKEFQDHVQSNSHWTGLLQRVTVQMHEVAGADHTFSTAPGRAELEARTLDWLRRSLHARQA